MVNCGRLFFEVTFNSLIRPTIEAGSETGGRPEPACLLMLEALLWSEGIAIGIFSA